jgi:hypothetical protein
MGVSRAKSIPPSAPQVVLVEPARSGEALIRRMARFTCLQLMHSRPGAQL